MKVTTRRSFFQYMAMLGMVTFSAAPLYAKGTKEKYLYQKTPKGDKECSICLHFIPEENKCKMVEGTISPHGYCAAFFMNPKKK
jgi:hypothetical protein